MSFEDDAYWESEYTDRSTARKAVSRQPDSPVDELAARRRRRQGRYRRPPKRDGGVQKGFDTERPGWLDDPDFVPTDVSGPDVAGPDSAVLDFNRPELGAFDAPSRPWTGRDVAHIEDGDWDDEIDEPYDHRAGMDRRSTVPGLGGHVRAPEDWDDPSPEDWGDPDEPSAGLDDDPHGRYRRPAEVRRDAWPDHRDDPRVLGRATPPRIISQAGAPPVPKQADPRSAPRILSGPARATPKPVAPAVGTAPVSPTSAAPVTTPAVGTAPVSPPSAPVSTPAVGTAPVSPAAVGTAPISPTGIGTAPVSPAAAAPASGSPAAAIATPAPPAGVLPPTQRAPGTDAQPKESTPGDESAGADAASSWFLARPRTPARSEVAAPDTSSDDGPAAGDPARPASALAPEDLQAVRWRLDGATLREVVDDEDALRKLGSRLDGPLAAETDHVARAGLLSLRAEVYRLLGELGMAAAASRLALAHAESARDVHAIVIAQAELAHVLRLGGHYAEADRLLEEAAGSEAPELLRSVVHEYAGRSCFDQGRHMEALNHFTRAIRLGAPDDLELVQRIDVCLEAVYIHVLRDGWGPYPRLRREILTLP